MACFAISRLQPGKGSMQLRGSAAESFQDCAWVIKGEKRSVFNGKHGWSGDRRLGRAFLARPNNRGAGWSMLGLVKNSTQPTGYWLPAFAGICIEICNGGR